MKKLALLLIALLLCVSLTTALAAGPFEVGGDTAEYAIDGASGWNIENVYVKIVAGEDVLFNGAVTLTSDNMLVSEFTYAAIVELGIGQAGVQEGFVTSIGDYVSGADADGNYVYWGYSVNGKAVPFACNQMRALEGDYILWEFQVYDEAAGLTAAETLPTGYDAPFEVGEDTAEYVIDGASGWNAYSANIKIAAGEDVLFNGKVALTSDNMLVSEFTYAALVELGVSQAGVQEGFVTSIGDYVSGTDADGNYVFWGYTVNGKPVPVGCNQMSVLADDYILWDFQVYAQ